MLHDIATGGPAQRPADRRQRVIAAASLRLADARAEDLLKFMTDRALADDAGVSASMVRRVFRRHRGSEELDRGLMLELVLVDALEREVEHRVARDAEVVTWLVTALGGPQGGAAAMLEALARAIPEPSSSLSALLQYVDDRRASRRIEAVERLLHREGRRPLPGFSTSDLATLLACVCARREASADDRLQLVWTALTVPA